MENLIEQNSVSTPDVDVNADISATEPTQIPETQEAPTLPDNQSILSLLTGDSRVAHFIVDVLHGVDPLDASTRHFPAAEPQPDIDSLINDAEQRGYLRGRNEVIEAKMQQPSVWETQGLPASETTSAPQILANLRPSIWD